MKKIIILLVLFVFILTSCNHNEEKETICDHIYDYSLNDDKTNIICKCQNCDYSYEIAPNFSFSYNYGYLDVERFLNKNNAQKLYINIYLKLLEFFNSKIDLESSVKNNEKVYEIASLNYSNLGLTKEEAMAIWHLVILDNPEFYFVEKKVLTSTTDIIVLCNKLYAKHEQRKTVDDKILELKNHSFKSKNTLEKISEIHDYVIDNMTYAYDYNNGEKMPKTDFDSYELSGALLYKEGVCEAYAKLFSYILKCNGIMSIMYTGNGILLSGESVRHAWTLVKIENLYYGFDLTWDDSNSNRDNYGLSYENLSARHQVIPFASSSLKNGIDYIYKMPQMAENNLI